MILRDYQQNILDQLLASRANDLVQLETGAGKTPIQAAMVAACRANQPCMVVAHRVTLIQQISDTLARCGIDHDTVSTEHTRRRCIQRHMRHGRSRIMRGQRQVLVVSIDSLKPRMARAELHIDPADDWLVLVDEAHHVLPDNKWGMLRKLLPVARIVGFTATPARMDGESLHVDNGGLFDRLIQADSLGADSSRKLIEAGWLSEYRAYTPISRVTARQQTDEDVLDDIVATEMAYRPGDHVRLKTIDVANMPEWRLRKYHALDHEIMDQARKAAIAAGRRLGPWSITGLDWERGKLLLAEHPVHAYNRLAPGSRAILMAPAIRNAEQIAESFKYHGIPAAAIHSNMTASAIARLLDAFAAGELRVLTNVDMVGEGYDLPACETLIICTRTKSFPRYRQWVGRIMRPSPGKIATLIDLTEQVMHHGLPDDPVAWDLLRPPCGPQHRLHVVCTNCDAWFPLREKNCPHCGHINEWLIRPEGFQPGNYKFDISILDSGLYEAARRELDAEQRAEINRTQLRQLPDYGHDAIGKITRQLAEAFQAALAEAGVSIEARNAFLADCAPRQRQWWVDRFSAADLRNQTKLAQKSLREFKKWQKSQ